MLHRGEVGPYWSCFLLVVQLCEDRHAGGVVSGFQSPSKRPVVFHVGAGANNPPQLILEPVSIVGAPMNLDIRHQAEQRAVPVSPPHVWELSRPRSPGAGNPFGRPSTSSRQTVSIGRSPTCARAIGST